ncbi:MULTISPECIES: transcriptional regulator [Acidianus]|nr:MULTISPECIES: transcriptional regulator [Acidianus]NON62666.1 ArsR family transcriptional regulator [Acidianus sp. RZ1]
MDYLKELVDLLNNRGLSNPLRLGILISLFNKERLDYSDIRRALNISKSNLSMNLQILTEEELVKVRKIPTITGVKTVVEITEKGKEIIKQYFKIMEEVRKGTGSS